jgi:hypothetical protein
VAELVPAPFVLECKTFLKRTAVEATLYIRFTTHRLLQSDEQIATAVGFFAQRGALSGALVNSRRGVFRSRRRETDLAQGEKRELFSPQSAGLPPREGVRGGPRLPSANAPRERAVLMRSSGCGASPRPEAFRAAGYFRSYALRGSAPA